jgi:predicted ATPase
MTLSVEMRRLQQRWTTAGEAWPKRLEWLEITGIRGWTGQRVDFNFPLVALVGENGSGKSTVLQAAAASYRSSLRPEHFASDFFPDTPFERVSLANIRFSYREGNNSQTRTIRKPTDRWRGNPERPERAVSYIDLSRIQPVGARVGFSKLLKSGVQEADHTAFDATQLQRLSQIVGKTYASAGISTTSADPRRVVPVLTTGGHRYSGFHQGAGEIAAAELLAVAFRRNSLVLIDEIETSLHPRAQRRLVRDLARIARELELQVILTTHSPYVLAELPPDARIYLTDGVQGKTVLTGVSPEFAMTRMDEEHHPECDVYVEDERAQALVSEAVVRADRHLLPRLQMIPFGKAQVGVHLGMMKNEGRFPRPSVVFLDGDQDPRPGCAILPGGDTPEHLVFDTLQAIGWAGIAPRIGRQVAETIDALNAARAIADHHRWVAEAANRLFVGGDILWQCLCAEWASIADIQQIESIVAPIQEALL